MPGHDDFHNPTHAKLYEHMLDRYRRGEPIELELLKQHFDSDDWAARLNDIIGNVPTHFYYRHYAGIVREKAKLRALQHIGIDLAEHAHGQQDKPDAVLDRAEAKLAGMRLAGERPPQDTMLPG